MALSTLKCNHLMPLHVKGLSLVQQYKIAEKSRYRRTNYQDRWSMTWFWLMPYCRSQWSTDLISDSLDRTWTYIVCWMALCPICYTVDLADTYLPSSFGTITYQHARKISRLFWQHRVTVLIKFGYCVWRYSFLPHWVGLNRDLKLGPQFQF